eukprot:692147-Prorocentrum_minimum.AAC.1
MGCGSCCGSEFHPKCKRRRNGRPMPGGRRPTRTMSTVTSSLACGFAGSAGSPTWRVRTWSGCEEWRPAVRQCSSVLSLLRFGDNKGTIHRSWTPRARGKRKCADC